jgi:hypothetical protein
MIYCHWAIIYFSWQLPFIYFAISFAISFFHLAIFALIFHFLSHWFRFHSCAEAAWAYYFITYFDYWLAFFHYFLRRFLLHISFSFDISAFHFLLFLLFLLSFQLMPAAFSAVTAFAIGCSQHFDIVLTILAIDYISLPLHWLSLHWIFQNDSHFITDFSRHMPLCTH